MKRVLSRLRDDRGFTLIEMMIASALFLLILGVVLSSFDSGTKSERISQARQEALVSLRQAMTQMTKELRQATSVATTSTATHIDMQTLVSGAAHHVVYDVSGAAGSAILTRSLDGAAPVQLASHVVAPQAFCYQYDDPNCLATSPASTLSSIHVSLELNPVIFSQGSITLATDVELRNISQ